MGVGSVGALLCCLMLNRKEEPLFIQVKEARQSVLQPFTAPSQYAHNGQRVVEGQRLVQAASDIFLGWSTGPAGRHFYLRQLRDRKFAPDVEHFDKELLSSYAKLCGRMLARAHAKTGDGALIAAYMGKSDVLDDAISKFALAYADQTERDYEDFKLIQRSKLAKGDEPRETAIDDEWIDEPSKIAPPMINCPACFILAAFSKCFGRTESRAPGPFVRIVPGKDNKLGQRANSIVKLLIKWSQQRKFMKGSIAIWPLLTLLFAFWIY